MLSNTVPDVSDVTVHTEKIGEGIVAIDLNAAIIMPVAENLATNVGGGLSISLNKNPPSDSTSGYCMLI